MRTTLLACSICSLLALGCSTSVPAGSERGPCYGNGTCDGTLVCRSGLCVQGDVVDGGIDAAPPGSDGGGDAGPLERRTYVVSQLTVPTTSAQASMLAIDLDGDGTVDNALGQVLSAFTTAGLGIDFQSAFDASVASGALILLVETRAASFTDGAAEGRVLEGSDPVPAPCTDPSMPTTCRMHLAGDGHFTVAPPAPPVSTMGAITAGQLTLRAATERLPLVFSATPVWFPIVEARTRATVGATGLTDGILAGAIAQSDVNASLIPAMYQPLAEVVARDCPAGACVSGSTGASIVGIFDTDGDSMVTLDELRTNSIIQSVLQPDLDLFDGTGARGTDGTADSMSIGLGFTAVGATFAAP